MATTRKAAKKATAPKKTVRALRKVTPARKATPRPPRSAKPASAPVRTAPIAKAVAPKADKPKKPKLVRDSFTIPKSEYRVLDELKQRAARLGRPAKKSEVLRAGLKALAVMGDALFLASLGAVPAIKTGRPTKD